MQIFCETNHAFNNQVEGSVPNLRRDDGQDFPALVDQIAGTVEDMQHARLARICQPVTDMRSDGKGINGLHLVHVQFFR